MSPSAAIEYSVNADEVFWQFPRQHTAGHLNLIYLV